MKICPGCRQYCADQKTTCPKCDDSLEVALDYHRQQSVQHTEAITELSAVLERNPGDTQARCRLIEIYQAQGDWPQVAVHLRVLADAAPHDLTLQTALVDVLGLAGCYGQAALILRALLAKEPDNADLQDRMRELLAWLRPEALQESQKQPLAQCWIESGDTSRQRGDEKTAEDCYRKAHQVHPASEAGRRLAEIYAVRAAVHEAQHREDLALATLAEALAFAPEDAKVRDRLAVIQRRRKRRRTRQIMKALAGIMLVACVAVFLYSYQGAVDVRLSMPGRAALVYDGWGAVACSTDPLRVHFQRRGETVGHADGSQVVTPLLPGGSYRLIAEKPGYRRVEQSVRIGFGRTTQVAQAALLPAYGTLTVNSDPSGASVTVQNAYETTTGTTPCILNHLFAMPASITLRLAGSDSDQAYQQQQEIPADRTLNLGTVSLRGTLRVDSKPSGGEVFVDGEKKGVTPLELAGLPATRIKLEIRKQGAGLFFQDCAIKPGTVTDLGAVTFSELGVLRVDSERSSDGHGAFVSLDRKEVGRAPLVLTDVPPGKHTVSLGWPHGSTVPFTKTLTFIPGQVHDLGTIVFEGSLRVDSDPPGAEVWLDDKKQGITPLILEKLRSQMHSLELKVVGEVRYSEVVTIPLQARLDLGILKLGSATATPHQLTLEISNGDDIATAYLNGSTLLQSKYGLGPAGANIGNQPGQTGIVDITEKMQTGLNQFRFTVWNAPTQGYVRGSFVLRVDGKVIYENGIQREDSSEGVKFDDRYLVTWPLLPTAANQRPRLGTQIQTSLINGQIQVKFDVGDGKISGTAGAIKDTDLLLVLQQIEKNFQPPEPHPGLKCFIKFLIHKNGTISNILIEHDTGYPKLDQMAVQALEKIKLPSGYGSMKTDLIPVSISFNF